MPGSPAAENLLMSHPGTDKAGKLEAGGRGGWFGTAGID